MIIVSCASYYVYQMINMEISSWSPKSRHVPSENRGSLFPFKIKHLITYCYSTQCASRYLKRIHAHYSRRYLHHSDCIDLHSLRIHLSASFVTHRKIHLKKPDNLDLGRFSGRARKPGSRVGKPLVYICWLQTSPYDESLDATKGKRKK